MFGQNNDVPTNVNYIIEAVSDILIGKETCESVKSKLDLLKVHITADTVPYVIQQVKELFPNMPLSVISLVISQVTAGRVTSGLLEPPPTETFKKVPTWAWVAIAIGAFLLLKRE